VDTELAVVGSLNHDLTVLTRRHPRPGETVLGTDQYSARGGKGANQAVAAARLGSRVAMIGLVGRDDNGAALVAGLAAEGIDVSAIGVDQEAPTGLAVITIDDRAENSIVVVPGANMKLSPAHIEKHHQVIATSRVVLAQLEVPMETVVAAAKAATGLFCLNPAPSHTIPEGLWDRIDVLVPNRSELAALANKPEPGTLDEVAVAVSCLPYRGPVVVTLGAEGALVVDDAMATSVPAPGIEAVDPTGSGDAFCGALAHALGRGSSLLDATRRAVVAGAIAATRRGAQPSMPTISEMDALLEG
jgi:ribokinase